MNKINFHGLLLILSIWLFFTTMTFLGCSSSSSSDSGASSNSSSAGSLDTSFGSGGKVTTRHGTGFAYAKAYSVDSQADGKIVAAGYVRTEGSPNNFIVVRYNTDGSLDSTFGTNGEATTPIGSNSIAHAVAIQADQKIITIGTAKIGFTNDFAVARYNADGSLDPTFGSGGIVTTSVGSGHYDWDDDRAYAVVVQADGKIVVAGYAFIAISDAIPDVFSNVFAVVRYEIDGSLDPTFGSGGIVTTAIGSINDYAYSIAQQTDGKIVVKGNTGISYSEYGCATVRYNIDGSLDSTFGSGGIVVTSLGLVNFDGSAIALQADSKIVVTGFVQIIRYNIDGSLDSTFGSGGIVTSAIRGVSSVAIQQNGKILAAGSLEIQAGDSDFAVVRYNTDGSLDSAFGSGGIATTSFGGSSDRINSLIILNDENFLVAGATDGINVFALACFWL